MTYKLFSLITIVLFTSCNLNFPYTKGYFQAGDNEFGDAILLEREDTIAYGVLEDGNKYLQKGTFIKYHNKSKIDTVFIWGETTIIKSHVNKAVSDSVFLLVDQKPLDSIFGEMIYEPYPHRLNFPSTPAEGFNMLNNSLIHCYWIVNKRSDDIYGPFNKKEFLLNREKIGVSKDLILKFEE